MKNKAIISNLNLQLAVLLFGGVALFARIIPVHSIVLVLGRCFFASVFLLIWMYFANSFKTKVKFSEIASIFTLNGLVLAVHWVLFFLSIKMSNVALGVITFSTFPFFIIISAPFFGLGKIEQKDIIKSVAIVSGVLVMVQPGQLKSEYMYGLFCGLGAAASFAMLTLLNKKFTKNLDSISIAFYQNVGATVFLLPAAFYFEWNLNTEQYIYWIILGVIFTGLAHTLYVSSLKDVSVQRAGLVATLEPIYAIAWSVILFWEWPLLREWIGAVIILSTVFFNSKK
jgi:drug/metabolite transporter (DMT)-like permease